MAVKEKSALGVIGEIARLRAQTAVSLRKRYDELCPGQEPRSNNHAYLLKKIAAKLQEQPGLEKSGNGPAVTTPSNRDQRLPAIGTIITKVHRGHQVKVVIKVDGFVHDGVRYRSLSAIARKLMGGTSINGYGFFGLLAGKGA